jgi:flagellar FliJ protein
MKKFKFNLEPVRDLRQRIEEEKQQILGERERELQAAENELAHLNSEFKRYSAALRHGHKSLTSDELRSHYAHLEYLDRCITMQHGVVLQRRTAVERARADLVEASKERKVIEKLKDKRLEEHRALEAVIEQKELDDANNRRTVRGNI